ncbi:MAG: transglutaminase family protein [Cyclobacteriaceae bacterium]|nr:transglutaminase family protein [Cyclobacteriaceae bacterium]
MNQEQLKALVSLLDDSDAEVIHHVEGEIKSLGEPIIPFLEEAWEVNSFNPLLQKKLENLIHDLQFEHLQHRLKRWNEEGADDLLEGMWLVASYLYPDLELEQLNKTLNQIYYEAWLEFKPDARPIDQVRLLNGVIFGKLRFSANNKNFHAPGNSMINSVLETKKGNPISLCVIYMLVARKLKMPVYGVNLPNLFILTYKDNQNQFYINAFNKGLIFNKKDIDNFLGTLNLAPKDIFYEPCGNAEIVRRTIRNLVVSFEKMGEHQKSEEVKQLLSIISDLDDDSMLD